MRDREGLRGNEGAYCVEKDKENGGGREGGDLACLYVCPYITS